MAKRPILRGAFVAVAQKLQEAADAADISSNDVKARLCDAINDYGKSEGCYCYFCDYIGDGESGDVIYSCDGDLCSAKYEMGSANGNATCNVDWENAENVVPHTTYEVEADDDDHYADMSEAFKADRLYTEMPVYERFISKDERSKADAGDFAGKGKSYPILKPQDVSAAVHAMGRAGSGNYGMAALKANIIRIAKKKGWGKYLPKSWQGNSTDSSEAGIVERGTSQLVLVESAATLEEIKLVEARADYEIKLIAPGKGSSAFYPAEVLRRDGPKVFQAGTHVYLNHPTAAEEAARPEGDVKNLAGVLSMGATYQESHPKGPGLYARMKVFADHAQTVEEKAPHVGMSIRASGVAEAGNKFKDGVPVLKELISAESVDVVTRAGAGGMILTESAHSAQTTKEAGDMTAEEAKKLIEAEVAPFKARALRGDAREEAARLLEDVSLPETAKRRVIETALQTIPEKEGALDVEKFRESVVAAARREGEYLREVTGSGRVVGMGAAATTEALSKKERKALKEAAELEEQSYLGVFESLMGSKKAAEMAFKGRPN